MRGQRYRARDKTVQKMGRDGLSQKNLRSGEAVRVSKRETDHLTLSKTADDSMNLQDRRGHRADRKKAEERRRSGYSPDFKRPEDGAADGVQSGLYQTIPEETALPLYREETGETETEMAQGTVQDQAPALMPDLETREADVRQERTFSHRTSGRKRRYIPEPSAARYRNQRRNRVQEVPGRRVKFPDTKPENFEDKSRRFSADTGRDGIADGALDMAPGMASDTGSYMAPDTEQITPPPMPTEKRKMFAQMYGRKEGLSAKRDTGEPFSGQRDTVEHSSGQRDTGAYFSRQRNAGEHPAGMDKNLPTGESSRQDVSHNRRKKQVYTYARKMKEQKKAQEQKEASVHLEEKRHTGNRLTAGEALQKAGENAEKSERYWRRHKGEEKKAGRLLFGKEDGVVYGKGRQSAKRAAFQTAGLSVAALTRDREDEPEEDMETGILRDAKEVGNRAFRYALRPTSVRMQKREPQTGGEILETDRKKERKKFYQKKRNKKAYAEKKQKAMAAGRQEKETGTFLEKARGVIEKVLRDKKSILIAAAVVILLFLFFGACFSSCSAMVQGTASTFIGTTYPSRDGDIYAAEDAYIALEEGMEERIANIEDTYPGYDEYRYQVDEITHNPYQLISFLTVLYEEFTYELVEEMAMLPVFFSEQYVLTVEEDIEIRTRMEPKTVIDPETGEETEVEVEVEYEWHILYVCLTNRGFDTVARNHMTQEQAALYDAYNLTYGNRSYLFDVGSLPTDNSSGLGYEIPAEALSDVQFARMIQEAEKYLGYPYVWGGDSPQTGFDCSGFVCWVANHCGNGWDVGRQTAEGLRGKCTAVSPSAAKPGNLIFFQGTYHTSGASHVGIYVGNGMMINAGSPVKYANINTPYWKGHFLSYGRIN